MRHLKACFIPHVGSYATRIIMGHPGHSSVYTSLAHRSDYPVSVATVLMPTLPPSEELTCWVVAMCYILEIESQWIL